MVTKQQDLAEDWEQLQEFQEGIPDQSMDPINPPREKIGLGGVVMFQTILTVLAVVMMVLCSTFFPQIYQSIDRCLKEELSRQVNFQKDGEKAAEVLQQLLNLPEEEAS